MFQNCFRVTYKQRNGHLVKLNQLFLTIYVHMYVYVVRRVRLNKFKRMAKELVGQRVFVTENERGTRHCEFNHKCKRLINLTLK